VQVSSPSLTYLCMNNVIIRKATLEDIEVLKLLFDELTMADLPYDKEIDINWSHTKNGHKYFVEKINGTKGICFVAENDGKIIGYCTAEKLEVPTYRSVVVASLDNLVVSEKYRSMGIGKKLSDVFMDWAKTIGAQKVSVDVFSGNVKGIAFYMREGFTQFETVLEKSLV